MGEAESHFFVTAASVTPVEKLIGKKQRAQKKGRHHSTACGRLTKKPITEKKEGKQSLMITSGKIPEKEINIYPEKERIIPSAAADQLHVPQKVHQIGKLATECDDLSED